jgi:hypothetical protein
MSTRGSAATLKPRTRSPQANAPNSPPMVPGGRDAATPASVCRCDRVAGGRRRVCAESATGTASGAESGAGHHRHASRRSPWCLRQHDRRHAEHGSTGSRGGSGSACVGAGATHAAVARLAPERALPGRTWDSRQRLAAASPECAAARRDPEATGLPNRCLRVLDCVVEAIRARPRVRHVFGSLRDWRR